MIDKDIGYRNYYKKKFVKVPFSRSLMLISNKFYPRFNFIHINKCGGSAIEKALKIPKLHDSAKQRKSAVGNAAWERAYNFAVVRHPLSRYYSFYRYRLRQNFADMYVNNLSFNSWMLAIIEEAGEVYEGQTKNTNSLMLASQFDWISDDTGNIIVDKVIALEKLGDKWAEITTRIGYPVELTRYNQNNTFPNQDLQLVKGLLSVQVKEQFMAKYAKDLELHSQAIS